MAISPFGSELYGTLFACPVARAQFSDEAEIAAMLRFEAALARAQGRVGILPPEKAEALALAIGRAEVSAADLTDGTGRSGMPVPALVGALRRALPAELADVLHFGATSQDVLDTALMLRLRPVLETLEDQLSALRRRLAGLADDHRRTPMVARTRWQQASPTSFGLKAAGWLDPLNRLADRLTALRPRVLVVQCGGAAGNLAHAGAAGPAMIDALAAELDLAPTPPWHAARDRIGELAGWLAEVTASLGKFGTDLVLMAQSEVGEIALASTGGSSTLPQKQNPVGPEALVALARFAAAQPAVLFDAAVHAHERDGAAWTAEWLALPPLVAAAESALGTAGTVAAGLAPNTERMLANIEASHGLVFAEAASFALAEHMPKAAAQTLVKDAIAAGAGRDAGSHLIDRLAASTDVPVDWCRVRDPAAQLDAVDGLIDRILAAAGG